MKISYITIYNALDVHNWSGLGYNIAKALENQKAEINYIGNLYSGFSIDVKIKKLLLKGFGNLSMGDRSPFLANEYAKEAERRLNPDTDVIFSPGTLPIAKMKNKYRKVFYTDATFAGMLDFYDDYTKFSKETVRACNELEQQALDNCQLAIYSSAWAAKTALDNYDVDPAKIKVVPFGANLIVDRSITDIKRIVANRSKTICKLLFLGVDWKRKGGDKALQIAGFLNKMGVKVELHVAGIKNLSMTKMPPFVKNHGFLSKATLDGTTRMENLFEESHFLVLPSTADCSPVVFSEASSYGVPSLSTNVGGITSIITDGKNGKTFPMNAGVEEYANFIQSNFNNLEKYKQLAHSSFNEYQNKLNWSVAGATIMGLLENVSSRQQLEDCSLNRVTS